jgi:hypothetical protein
MAVPTEKNNIRIEYEEGISTDRNRVREKGNYGNGKAPTDRF